MRLNPFVDWSFKFIFQREVNKDLLIEFLNDLLVGEHRIVELQFRNKEIQPEEKDGRVIIFDILCTDEDGSIFLVEMQNAPQYYFLDRGIYYICRMISEQGQKGKDWKYQLYPVYGIYLLNFKMPPLKSLRTNISLCDEETGEVVSKKMRHIFLCLPYFKLKAEECKTDFERWIYLLKHMETLEGMPFKAQKTIFSKLLEVADVGTLSKEDRIRYDEALKSYRDYNSCMYYAVNEASKKALEKGLKEGELKKAREMARRLKAQGVDPLVIAQASELSLEEIERL